MFANTLFIFHCFLFVFQQHKKIEREKEGESSDESDDNDEVSSAGSSLSSDSEGSISDVDMKDTKGEKVSTCISVHGNFIFLIWSINVTLHYSDNFLVY